MTQSRRHFGIVPLVCAVAATRYLFRSRLLYDIDSVNFGLALGRFDPAAYQPHPPGYFLYIMLGRLVQAAIPNANSAFVAISIAASCAAAIVIYRLGLEWYGSGPAAFSVLLFLFSPLCWFHGTVALTYIVEAFFSGLVGLWCWKAYTGRAAFAVPAAAAYALAAGFRPSTALFLAPVLIAALLKTPARYRWTAGATVAAVSLAWFLPMLQASGGLHAYFEPLAHLWRTVPGQRTVLSNAALPVARLAAIALIFVLCFGSAALLLAVGESERPDRSKSRFTFLWVVPGLLFFSLVFLNFVNSGYLLVLCPPVFAFLGSRAYRFAASPASPVRRRLAIGLGIAANVAIFLWAPVYCSYAGVRGFEREMASLRADFSGAVDPANTLIIGFDSHFFGFRHAGYYLPAFLTLQYPEVSLPEGKRVFAMQGRDTRVLDRFDASRFDRFLFFPLPAGGEYRAYVDRLLARLPSGAVTELKLNGRPILQGPAWAIPLLFPGVATCPMYTSLHEHP